MIQCQIFGCKTEATWQRVLALRGPRVKRPVEAYYCDACKVFWDARQVVF